MEMQLQLVMEQASLMRLKIHQVQLLIFSMGTKREMQH